MVAKCVIDVPLGGLDTGTDPLLVQPGRALGARGCEWFQSPGLVKRPGLDQIAGPAGVVSILGLASLNGELLAMDGKKLYALDPTGWIDKGSLPLVRVTETEFGAPATSVASGVGTVVYPVTGVDVAATQYSWWVIGTSVARDATGLGYGSVMLIGRTDNSAKQVWTGGAGKVRCVTSGSNTWVLYEKYVGSAWTLACRVISDSNPYASAEYTGLATLSASSGGCWDACVITGDATQIAVVIGAPGGTWDISTIAVDGTLTGRTTTSAANKTDVGIVCARDAGNSRYVLMVGYTDSGTNKPYCWGIRTDTWADQFTGTAMDSVALATKQRYAGVEESTGTVRWIYSRSTAANIGIRTTTVTVAGVASAAYDVAERCEQASRPFVKNGSTYAFAKFASTTQGTMFLVDLLRTYGSVTRACPAARMMSGLVSQSCYSTSVVVQGATATTVGAGYYSQNGSNGPSPTLLEAEFGVAPSIVEFDGRLMIASGLLYEYDGCRLIENGFLLNPELSYTSGTGGSGGLPDGVYSAVAVYEVTDRQNKVHRSGVSAPLAVTISGGGGSAWIRWAASSDILSLWPWHKSSSGSQLSIRSRIYCTKVNGSVHYYVGDCVEMDTQPTGSEQQPYTDDGTLEFCQPDQLVSLAVKGKRLYGITQGGTLQYTHETVDGESPSFSPLLYSDFSKDGNEYALAVVDEQLLVFSGNQVRVVQGGGLGATGSYNDLSEPRTITGAPGRFYRTPVVETPVGVVYQSLAGIRLLDRSLTSQPIGDAVRSYVQDRRIGIVGAFCDIERRRVLLSTDTTVLCYHYLTGQWSEHIGTHAGFTGAASHTYPGVIPSSLYFVSGVNIAKQYDGGYYDNQGGGNSYLYAIDWTSPWIRLGGIQGRQRVWRMLILGTYRSPCKMNVAIYYDYSSSPATTVTVDFTTGYSSGQPIMLRKLLSKRCEAVKVRIYDSNQSGTCESYWLSGLAVEGIIKPGAAKRSAVRTV